MVHSAFKYSYPHRYGPQSLPSERLFSRQLDGSSVFLWVTGVQSECTLVTNCCIPPCPELLRSDSSLLNPLSSKRSVSLDTSWLSWSEGLLTLTTIVGTDVSTIGMDTLWLSAGGIFSEWSPSLLLPSNPFEFVTSFVIDRLSDNRRLAVADALDGTLRSPLDGTLRRQLEGTLRSPGCVPDLSRCLREDELSESRMSSKNVALDGRFLVLPDCMLGLSQQMPLLEAIFSIEELGRPLSLCSRMLFSSSTSQNVYTLPLP